MLPIFTFQPFFKSVIWGGNRIARFKGIPSQGDSVGESWELSPMPGRESVVDSGKYKGESLNELVARFPIEILGMRINDCCHGRFPLLVKFIDAADDLSVQVHPDNDVAMSRHNSPGKSELWYVLHSEPEASLLLGFNRPMNVETFRRMIADHTLVEALHKYDVKPGDVFYIPAGRIHSIGSGTLIVEIQQASDITYRLYDYDRRDAAGNPRELHVEQSLEVLDYVETPAAVRNVQPAPGQRLNVAHTPYFNADVMSVKDTLSLDLKSLDSFTIFINIEGDITLEYSENRLTHLPQGHTALIPACIPSVKVSGTGKLLSVNL